MEKSNKEVHNNFQMYWSLLKEEKIVSYSPIPLRKKKNNPRWLLGDAGVKHITLTENISLMIEKSLIESKYGIKLRCPSLCEPPYFRFDSDGPAHRNNNSEIPLEEQIIDTPHFNCYDELGRAIAYKSDILKDAAAAEAIVKNIDFGIAHFCHETNMALENKSYPTTFTEVMKLFPDDDTSDHLKDIIFE